MIIFIPLFIFPFYTIFVKPNEKREARDQNILGEHPVALMSLITIQKELITTDPMFPQVFTLAD